jgi:hypothetical protein
MMEPTTTSSSKEEAQNQPLTAIGNPNQDITQQLQKRKKSNRQEKRKTNNSRALRLRASHGNFFSPLKKRTC